MAMVAQVLPSPSGEGFVCRGALSIDACILLFHPLAPRWPNIRTVEERVARGMVGTCG